MDKPKVIPPCTWEDLAWDQREVTYHVDNTEPLFRQKEAIIMNLEKFYDKGVFKLPLAHKAFMHLVNTTCKHYLYPHNKSDWHKIFPIADRRVVAWYYATRVWEACKGWEEWGCQDRITRPPIEAVNI